MSEDVYKIDVVECNLQITGTVKVSQDWCAERVFKVGPAGVTLSEGLIQPSEIAYNPYKILEHLVEEHLRGNKEVASLIHEEGVNEAN